MSAVSDFLCALCAFWVWLDSLSSLTVGRVTPAACSQSGTLRHGPCLISDRNKATARILKIEELEV
ncbi:MAG: hypothetical protein AABY51_08655 [Deltaproteobacteria bacterium]